VKIKDIIVESSNMASAEQIWDYVGGIHPKDQQGGGFLKRLIMRNPQYELKRVPLSSLHVPNDEDDGDDPYGRAMFVDVDHAREYSQHHVDKKPVVADAEGHILDGAHRAWAAAELLNRTDIMAWVPAKKLAEGKVKLYTDPGYFGAEVDDAGFDSLPVVNISADRLVGFEPDSKMNQPKSQANVKKIVAGLKKGDKLPPLLVRKYKNGYQVLDGHHRFWAYKLSGTKSIPVRIVADKDIEEISKQGMAEGFSLGNMLPWPEVVNKINSAMRAMGWKGQRKDDGSFVFTTRGAMTDEYYIVIIDNEGDSMFTYALGTVEEGDPHIGEQDTLPTTEASVSELMNAVRDGFGLNENFADGKNPGRKGLAKRSGVNTKASVSSLRKTAKNSSGEKQRMAHWLANMKAGRAKAKKK
jgi:hypothetical protein